MHQVNTVMRLFGACGVFELTQFCSKFDKKQRVTFLALNLDSHKRKVCFGDLCQSLKIV